MWCADARRFMAVSRLIDQDLAAESKAIEAEVAAAASRTPESESELTPRSQHQ